MTNAFIRSSKFLKAAATVVLGVLFVVLLTQRLAWIWEKDYPIATDSFYYLLELRSYASEGAGTYTTYNPFFLTLTGVQLVLGTSPETTYNVLVSFNVLILGVALLLAASSSSLLVGLLINAAFLASDTLFYRIYAFPQQALSMGLFVLGLSLLTSHDTDSRLRWKLPIIPLSLLFFSSIFHLTGAALTTIVGLGSVMSCGLTPLLRAIAVMLVMGLLGVLLWFADRPLFSFSMTELLPGLPKTCDFTSCSNFERFESWLYLVGALMLLFQVRSQKQLLTLLCVFFALNAPFWTTEGHMAYRLALTSVWLFYLAAALASSRYPAARATTAFWSFSLLIGHFTLTQGAYKDPGIAATILEQYASIAQRWIPPHGIILAPHGTQFRLRYLWRREAVGGPGVKIPGERETFVLTRRPSRQKCRSIDELTELEHQTTQCIQLDRSWSLVKITR